MLRIYLTPALFLLTLFFSEVAYRFLPNKTLEERKTFSHIVRKQVIPDQVALMLSRSEPFGESATESVRAVSATVNNLREAYANRREIRILTGQPELTKKYLASAAGAAVSFAASVTVEVELRDVGLIPELTKIALDAGFTGISVVQQTVSDKLWMETRRLAIDEAHSKIRPHIDEVTSALRIKVRDCRPPEGGVGISAGDTVASEGFANFDPPPEVIPISSVIRPLKSLIIEESEYEGSIDIARSVSLQPVEVSGKAELSCAFSI